MCRERREEIIKKRKLTLFFPSLFIINSNHFTEGVGHALKEVRGEARGD